MKLLRILPRAGPILAAAAMALSTSAWAGFSWTLHPAFSGTTPEGSITATFSDTLTPGVVQLVLQANLAGTEFIGGEDGWLFNVDPAFGLTSSSFTETGRSGDFGALVVSVSPNAYKPDGDGYFDIQFAFGTSNNGGRFDGTDSVTYNITYAGLTASAFYLKSLDAQGGGPGPFYSAAHVQSIGPNDKSGWIAPGPTPVPEPSTALAAALLGLPFGIGLIRQYRRTR